MRLNGNEYRKRAKAKWLEGKEVCAYCATTQGPFDIDHIVPKFLTGDNLKTRDLWSFNEERIEQEMTKCQVLCKPCHIIKTSYDMRLWHAMRKQGLING